MKTTTTARKPSLRGEQRNGKRFVEDRLDRAAGGKGHWANTPDPNTEARAEALRDEVGDSGYRGQVIRIREGAPPGKRVSMENW